MAGNTALQVNQGIGGQGDLAITTRGSDWYFAVTAIMGAATVIFMGSAFMKPQSHRIFHYITAGITAIATIAYFSMGSGLGQVPILAEFMRPNSAMVSAAGTREIYWVRYIDWALTTPLLLLDLLLTAGVPTPTILAVLLADEIMIVTGLVGALTYTVYKWGYWTFGMAALFFIAYELLFDGRKHAYALGGAPQRAYMIPGCWLIFLWFLYPIAWGVSEGGNVIHPDSEAIFYGILDVLAKPVFGALLLYFHRDIAPADVGLSIREPGAFSEKGRNVAPNPTATGGVPDYNHTSAGETGDHTHTAPVVGTHGHTNTTAAPGV